MLVYSITNKVNGKLYIGMTSRTLEERWKAHCSSARNGSIFRFHSAIRKYGETAFIPKLLFDNLDIDQCRKVEEQMIIEHNTIAIGYNAKPGGCGGWIVPDEKYDGWLINVSRASTREGNGRWSGYSDEFILDQCVSLFEKYDDPKDFSYKGILDKLRSNFDGIPKSFSKNRFAEYQNSFKLALATRLRISKKELDKLSFSKTSEHKAAVAKSIRGRNWYSNDKLMISKQSQTNPGTDWYKGRKYGIKN